MFPVTHAEFDLPSYEGLCPVCRGEGNHEFRCPRHAEEVAAANPPAAVAERLAFSLAFWCGVETPVVEFWRAVLDRQGETA